MRILFVSNSFPNNLSISPNPSINGTQHRLDMLIGALGQIAQLDVLFYVPNSIEISPASLLQIEKELSEYWQIKLTLHLCPQYSLPKWRYQLEGIFDFSKQAAFIKTTGVRQIQAFEECLSRKPDVIFVQRLQSIHPVLSSRQALPPIFYDIDDIEHIKLLRQLRRASSSLAQSFYYLHFPALFAGEYRAIQQATRAFVCSDLDRQYLSQRWKLPGIVTIPNSVSIPAHHPISSEPTLLLLGSYHYPPNTDAANFLIDDVFPLIQKELPHARLLIAGSNPEHIRSYGTGAENVEFTGFVNDLDELYRRSRVMCCPIFSGGGTRLKMIEAAAYGKPIIATSIGAEGLAMTPGKDFLLCETAQDFAAGCLELLRNDDLCDRLGVNARAAAIQHYDRAHIMTLIQQQIQSVLKQNLMPIAIHTQLNPPVS